MNESIKTSLRTVDSVSYNMSNVNSDTNELEGWISDDVMQYIYTINFGTVCASFCLFGIVTNIINIVVFVRQGFQETVNISLFGLALSDLCSLITLLWTCICYHPWFMYSDLPVLSIDLQHHTGGWPHVIFNRVTGFITVFVTLERCLCIAFPLKVKSILTTKRVTIVIICIYLVTIGTMIQNYFVMRLDWKPVKEGNGTAMKIGLIYNSKRLSIERVSHYIQSVYPLLAFAGVLICSGILIVKLNQRSRWLQMTTSTRIDSKDTKTPTTIRDRQVVKLVETVAAIFIVCFTPHLCFCVLMAVNPEIDMGLRYENLFIIIASLATTTNAINSSVNIFVYYRMSSKYKLIFRGLFCKEKK